MGNIEARESILASNKKSAISEVLTGIRRVIADTAKIYERVDRRRNEIDKMKVSSSVFDSLLLDTSSIVTGSCWALRCKEIDVYSSLIRRGLRKKSVKFDELLRFDDGTVKHFSRPPSR